MADHIINGQTFVCPQTSLEISQKAVLSCCKLCCASSHKVNYLLITITILKVKFCSQVSIADDKLAAGPLVAKVYDASLIKVTDVGNAVVGQQCQFKGR